MATETVTQTTRAAPFIEAAGKTFLDDLQKAIGGFKTADLSQVYGPQFPSLGGCEDMTMSSLHAEEGLCKKLLSALSTLYFIYFAIYIYFTRCFANNFFLFNMFALTNIWPSIVKFIFPFFVKFDRTFVGL